MLANKISVLIVLIMVNFKINMAQDPQFYIESPRVTDWGDWGPLEACAPGSFVFGFRLKVEPYQSVTSDDCALNAIELLCASPTMKRGAGAPVYKSVYSGLESKAFSTIVSSMGHRGDWGLLSECPVPTFATGFQLRQEGDQGWSEDDTAANDFKLICSDGTELMSNNGSPYGGWSENINCPRGTYICAIQTQVESPQDLDDTTLNNVKLGCCAY